jgi:hypothetical protein
MDPAFITSKVATAATAAAGSGAILAQAAGSPQAGYTLSGVLVLAVVALWRALSSERKQRDAERAAFERTMRNLGRAEGRAETCPVCGDRQ